MYGIVNKAIEDLVKENFGAEKWEAIKNRSGVTEDFFISNEPYDDAITFRLAHAVSAEMEMPLEEVFEAFGQWWVLRTGKEKYGGLMETGGDSLREFLVNLPVFHSRVMLIYPRLTPPEFRVVSSSPTCIHVHYHSKRKGLQDFVRGLLQGIGRMYQKEVSVQLIQTRDEGATHEIFTVSWEE